MSVGLSAKTKITYAALMALALAVALGSTNTVSAQSISPFGQAVHSAIALEKEMSTALNNLRQMTRGLTSTESGAATDVFQAEINFHCTLNEVITIGQILGDMKSAEDRSTVGQYFSQSSRDAVAHADIAIEYINNNLVAITTPAALAEATKIRDAVVRLREVFQQFAAKRVQ
jgi:hypothetical protein